jgi:hypothetical protein
VRSRARSGCEEGRAPRRRPCVAPDLGPFGVPGGTEERRSRERALPCPDRAFSAPWHAPEGQYLSQIWRPGCGHRALPCLLRGGVFRITKPSLGHFEGAAVGHRASALSSSLVHRGRGARQMQQAFNLARTRANLVLGTRGAGPAAPQRRGLATTMRSALLPVTLRPSLTSTVKMYVPASVGKPARRPRGDSRRTPRGRRPRVSVHVIGPTPPRQTRSVR